MIYLNKSCISHLMIMMSVMWMFTVHFKITECWKVIFFFCDIKRMSLDLKIFRQGPQTLPSSHQQYWGLILQQIGDGYFLY